MKLKIVVSAALLAAGLVTGGVASAQEKLTVWWVKGFYKAEDDALFAAIKKYETDRKSTRLNSSHIPLSRMPSSA